MKSKLKKYLILGAGGQLGTAFCDLLRNKEIKYDNYQAWLSTDFDLEEPHHFNHLKEKDFDVLINAAAYTQVDQAEKEPERAFRINAEAVGQLAAICKSKNAIMLHFSSDYVYHNSVQDRPICENDPLEPKGVYAKSKLKGEQYLKESGAKHMIFRTSWVFSHVGHNFVHTMLKLAESRDTIRIVKDQIGSPTYAPDLAKAVIQASDTFFSSKNAHSALYNLCQGGTCSWYEFARTIFEMRNFPIILESITYEEFGSLTPRPLNSRLDCSKIKKELGIEMRNWQDALADCLKMM
jgi:dTDP-4-dehydrorhamnose reductase